MKKVTLTILGIFLFSLAPLFSDECDSPDVPTPTPGEKEKTTVTQPLKNQPSKKLKSK